LVDIQAQKLVQSIGLRKNPLDSCFVDSPVLRNRLASVFARKFFWIRLAELNTSHVFQHKIKLSMAQILRQAHSFSLLAVDPLKKE
jgi:hypothetical protein